jgi:hypothetical protein
LLFINIFNLQYFFSYKLRLLDVSRAQWSFLWRRTCEVKTVKMECNISSTIALNTSWYVRLTSFFFKLLFSWIEFDDFFFNFKKIYNSHLRERYEDVLRPTQISIQICRWRQDYLMDRISYRLNWTWYYSVVDFINNLGWSRKREVEKLITCCDIYQLEYSCNQPLSVWRDRNEI